MDERCPDYEGVYDHDHGPCNTCRGIPEQCAYADVDVSSMKPAVTLMDIIDGTRVRVVRVPLREIHEVFDLSPGAMETWPMEEPPEGP